MLAASFVALAGAGCDWISGSECSGGCIDAEGTCRQLSPSSCGVAGEQCVDCTLDGMVCDTIRGQCRPPSDSIGGSTEQPVVDPSRCCLLEDGYCVPLGDMCSYVEECRMSRGGPACKELEDSGPTGPRYTSCQSECTDGCCTKDGVCLQVASLIGCPVSYCDEENAYSGKCEAPLERCKRDCYGCCTRDGECVNGDKDEQCGVDGAECNNCGYRGLSCDRDEQKCLLSTQSGRLRICIESVRIEAGDGKRIEDVDACKATYDKLAIQAEMYVTDGYITGIETTREGFGQIIGNSISASFTSACFAVDEDEPADELVIKFSEQDDLTGTSDQLRAHCQLNPTAPGCPALLSGGTNDGGCEANEKLGRCVLDISNLRQGGGSGDEAITVRDCRPDSASGASGATISAKIEVRQLRSYRY